MENSISKSIEVMIVTLAGSFVNKMLGARQFSLVTMQAKQNLVKLSTEVFHSLRLLGQGNKKRKQRILRSFETLFSSFQSKHFISDPQDQAKTRRYLGQISLIWRINYCQLIKKKEIYRSPAILAYKCFLLLLRLFMEKNFPNV